jgi:hypothetical protein
MGNRFQRPHHAPAPVINDEREAMDLILEMAGEKMSEGDYLKISKCLKVIHESKKPNVIPVYQILNTTTIEGSDNVYVLTRDETIQLMRWRYKDYYEFCILKLEESIAEDQLLLRETIKDKKVAWSKYQEERTDELRQEHKQLVQNEKILKVKINELLAEIRGMDNILQEFNLGNYTPVHLQGTEGSPNPSFML